MPDFDIDFCMDGRDEVIDYVRERTGATAVAQIITYGTAAGAGGAARRRPRAAACPTARSTASAKLVPNKFGQVTLDDALEDGAAAAGRWKPRTRGRAADRHRPASGGSRAQRSARTRPACVISDRPLTESCPLYRDRAEAAGNAVQHEATSRPLGLVKFDFLGLRTLTVIDARGANWCATGEGRVDLDTLPLNDPATYELLRRGDTVGVFQLEARGMRDLLRGCSRTASRTSSRSSPSTGRARWTTSRASSAASTARAGRLSRIRRSRASCARPTA